VHRTHWSTSLALDAVISYTGLHLYSRGDGRRGELASYTFTGSLVSWVPVESILVITIVDGHDEEEGGGAGGGGASYGSMLNLGAAAAPKRFKNISLHSHEAKLMSQLLTAFAAAVTEERARQQEELERRAHAKRRVGSMINSHRAGGSTNRGGGTRRGGGGAGGARSNRKRLEGVRRRASLQAAAAGLGSQRRPVPVPGTDLTA